MKECCFPLQNRKETMSKEKSFTVLYGDARQEYLLSILKENGYRCQDATNPSLSATTISNMIESSDYILAPTPFCRNNILTGFSMHIDEFTAFLHSNQHLFAGAIPKGIISKLSATNILCHDYMEDEQLAIFNSIATSEGLICEIISSYPSNLTNTKVLILGYGKCAKTLAHHLNGLGCSITICARNEAALTQAATFSYSTLLLSDLKKYAFRFPIIINTIPKQILTKEILLTLSKENSIYDIASYPGGTDFISAKDLKIPATLHLGLPGKYSPKSSATALFQYIQKNTTEISESKK